MHRDFLPFLVDPKTHEALDLEVKESNGEVIQSGVLTSRRGRYPIINGVPRFGGERNYSNSFGYQWRKWPRIQFESENIGKAMEGHTRTMWERITGFKEHGWDIAGKTVLDIGCGPGRFIEIARSKGAKVIGIDYSLAVEAAHENFIADPNVCICQADALNSPIRTDAVDAAYSIGVLHHTPSPECGVREGFRILKRGGWFALSVYGKGGYYDFPSVQAWRRLFNYLWPIFGHYAPLIYTYLMISIGRPVARRYPILGKAIRLFVPFVNLPDKYWSILDTFDSLVPSYQSAHESYEVFYWLKRAGFRNIEPTNWNFTSFRCVKSDSDESAGQDLTRWKM